MSYKVTTVPGVKHAVIQALLAYWIKATLPKGCHVAVDMERYINHGPDVFRIDVSATYYKSAKRAVVYYEVQDKVNVSTFVEKMQKLKGVGEIVDLNKCPDDIASASEFVRGLVVLPDFKRRE